MAYGFVGKVFRVVTSRPTQFWMNARGYLLFCLTRLAGYLFMTESSGISLGKNVRVQRLRCLSAERPHGRIGIGSHSVIYENAQLAAYGNGSIQLGENSIVGDVRIYCRERITIGKRAVFSWNVFIQDFHPHPLDPDKRGKQLESMTLGFMPAFDGHKAKSLPVDWVFPTEPVELGDDIWFGANCTVLPGARVGSGSIIAAGAVVVKGEYPPRSVLAGNPARVVKTL